MRQKVPCSIRAKQIGVLRFPYRKLGSTRDIFRLWGGELVVSDRFVNLVQEHRFTGAKFSPTCDTAGPGRSGSAKRGICAALRQIEAAERNHGHALWSESV